MCWDAKTGFENEKILDAVGPGSGIVVEAVPEPGNPRDHTAVARDVGGVRVGYMPSAICAQVFPALVEANKAGLYIMMQAKVYSPTGSWNGLMVRSSDGADLRAWLMVPEEARGSTFFELAWVKPGRQFAYQVQISAAMRDADESQLFLCNVIPNSDERHPGADLFVAGIHVGQLGHDGSGQQIGFARFHKWPDNIEMKVVLPLADGTWPRSTPPFAWKR
jgi:hypothetical protein